MKKIQLHWSFQPMLSMLDAREMEGASSISMSSSKSSMFSEDEVLDF